MDKFKDSRGFPLTTGLFWELAQEKSYAIYTIKEHDHTVDGVTYVSLKTLYLAERDPTEYLFAIKYVGSWEQWQRIAKSNARYGNKTISALVQGWREELELKIQAENLKQIASLAKGEKGYQAAKFLVDKGWVTKTRGAPSKEEREGEKKKATRLKEEVSEDMARLGFNVVK